jgi:hypothetical protein
MKPRTDLRIHCRSSADAKELALRLEADGHRIARRRRAVIVRTETRTEAEALARKLQVDAVVVGARSQGRPRGAWGLVAGLKRV